MDAQKRRQAIAHRLEQAEGAVSASVLAKEFSVSRQVIVGDIALLRAGGLDIAATPRGYILPSHTPGVTHTLACRHSGADMERELLQKANALGIGPQGLGGRTTVLGVNIETYATHIAGLPVAVNINCHATRHVTIKL